MFELISTALAESGEQIVTGKDSLASLLPIMVIFSIFYFMLIRPQAKKQREHSLMLKQLKIGDKVTLVGSIVGSISRVEENTDMVQIEIAPGIHIEAMKSGVTNIMNKKDNLTGEKNKVEVSTQKVKTQEK